MTDVEIPTVVIATRNRRERLLATFDGLSARPERPPTIVVDKASDDSTAEAVRRQHPAVRVVGSRLDLGAAARTLGVREAATPLVAFSDDDSWSEPGALPRAAASFDAFDISG